MYLMHAECARRALWLAAAALSLFWISCAGGQFYRDVETSIGQGEYAAAIAEVRKNESWYGEKDAVLYDFDLGLLFHYAGEPDSSNPYLFDAERRIEELYTRSISKEVLSFLVNDNVVPYEGEDFEKVMLNVFLALNYAKLGFPDEALVEARKVDLKLREYARQYEDKNTYKEDAFIRYIAGALYESAGEINDAFISYRNSYETYKVYEQNYGTRAPSFLLDDLVRTAAQIGFGEEEELYRGLGGHEYRREESSLGSVLVIVYAGNAPVKVEERPSVTIPDSSGTLHTFQVALPKFVPRYVMKRDYDVHVSEPNGTLRCSTEAAQDITAIAGKCLEERLALIYLKSGGRALLKFLAAEKMKSEMKKDDKSKAKNFLGSLAIDLVMGATEQADVRSWRTLPGEIRLGRMHLAPGDYSVTVSASDGQFALRDIPVRVQKRKTTFVIVDDVR